MHLFLHLGFDDIFQFDNISRESSDSFGQLLRCHGIFVHHPAKALFVRRDLGDLLHRCGRSVEFLCDGRGRCSELVQQARRDGQTIATRQFQNLIGVTEGSAHDDCIVPELLVIVVNLRDGNNTRIFRRRKSSHTLFLFVEIHNTSDKGADERDTRFRTRNRLGDAKNERQIARNAFLFQHFGGTDTFPRGRDLDENSFLGNSHFLVHANDSAGLHNGRFRIKAQAGIDFRRDVTGDDLGDFGSEIDGEFVLSWCKDWRTRMSHEYPGSEGSHRIAVCICILQESPYTQSFQHKYEQQ